MQISPDIVKRHREWSEAQFGTTEERGPIGPLRHLIKEAQEAIENPDDIYEFADMQFLLLDALRRAGHTPEKLDAAMRLKMPILESRTYRKTEDTTAPVEHER